MRRTAPVGTHPALRPNPSDAARDDILALRQRPGERDLRRCCLTLGRKLAQPFDHRQVGPKSERPDSAAYAPGNPWASPSCVQRECRGPALQKPSPRCPTRAPCSESGVQCPGTTANIQSAAPQSGGSPERGGSSAPPASEIPANRTNPAFTISATAPIVSSIGTFESTRAGW